MVHRKLYTLINSLNAQRQRVYLVQTLAGVLDSRKTHTQTHKYIDLCVYVAEEEPPPAMIERSYKYLLRNSTIIVRY